MSTVQMGAGIKIRAATRGDVDLILELIRGLAEYERLAHEVVATEASLASSLFPEDGSRQAAEVLIAEFEQAPVGFALFFSSYSTFLGKAGIYLEDLFVVPKARGKGVGRALLKKLASLVIERGGGRLEWSVLDWNEPAIGFYRSIGAVGLEEWTVQRLTGPALEKLAASGPENGPEND